MTATASVLASDLCGGDPVRAGDEFGDLDRQLTVAQERLLQSGRMASIGQIAAGVAHEINSPIDCIVSNLGALERYLFDLSRVSATCDSCEPRLADAQACQSLGASRRDIDPDCLKGNIPTLLAETREGIERVRKVVQDLKDLSHLDTHSERERTDLDKGIDSTLNVVSNEIKHQAEAVNPYGSHPLARCLASQLNQVCLNLPVNAAHAIRREHGTSIVRTGGRNAEVWFEFEGDVCGIASEHLPRILDPFFTARPVAMGAGLGLSLSYGIVKEHVGRIDVDSQVGRGTPLRVALPMNPVKTTS